MFIRSLWGSNSMEWVALESRDAGDILMLWDGNF